MLFKPKMWGWLSKMLNLSYHNVNASA